MPEPALLCVGNLTVDEAVSPHGEHVESVGGDALYAALGALVAGGAPRVLAPLGSDAPDALRDAIRSAATDPDTLPARDAATVRNVVRYATDGSRTWDLVHGAAHFDLMSVHPADVSAAALAADGVLLSAMGLAPQLELAAWLRPRTGAVVYFDPQEDYIAGNEAALVAAIGACDVFLPSEVEATALTGTAEPDAVIRRLLALGPGVVVVKRAEAGCLVGVRGEREAVRVPADLVDAVDSTGAGDAFCGAFAAAHLRHRDPVEAARAGARAARIAVSGHGVDALLAAVRPEPVR